MDNMNQQFETYWNNQSIQNIMNKLSNRYSRNIDHDVLDSIKMDILWKCIDKYDKSKGTKFTSFLYQQLSYAFKNEIKKKRKEFHTESFDKQDENYDMMINVFDVVTGLDKQTEDILKMRFYDNLTMAEIGKINGYSRETARRRLHSAIQRCKKSSNN